MAKKCSFTALPDAVVRLGSITEFRAYMLAKRPEHRGLRVDRYDIRDGELRARLVYPDGSKAWEFAGYADDVARNAQLGYYEGGRSGDTEKERG